MTNIGSVRVGQTLLDPNKLGLQTCSALVSRASSASSTQQQETPGPWCSQRRVQHASTSMMSGVYPRLLRNIWCQCGRGFDMGWCAVLLLYLRRTTLGSWKRGSGAGSAGKHQSKCAPMQHSSSNRNSQQQQHRQQQPAVEVTPATTAASKLYSVLAVLWLAQQQLCTQCMYVDMLHEFDPVCRSNTLASMKRAQQAGDEWARIFALQIQVRRDRQGILGCTM